MSPDNLPRAWRVGRYTFGTQRVVIGGINRLVQAMISAVAPWTGVLRPRLHVFFAPRMLSGKAYAVGS